MSGPVRDQYRPFPTGFGTEASGPRVPMIQTYDGKASVPEL